jgi:hypothetical protein
MILLDLFQLICVSTILIRMSLRRLGDSLKGTTCELGTLPMRVQKAIRKQHSSSNIKERQNRRGQQSGQAAEQLEFQFQFLSLILLYGCTHIGLLPWFGNMALEFSQVDSTSHIIHPT